MELYCYSAIITVLTAVLLFALAFNVGNTRRKEKIKFADTYTTTNQNFFTANRVHLNTLENVVVFLPLLWIATLYANPLWASIIGAVWFASRIAYAFAYLKQSNKRAPAFLTGVFCLFLLIVLSVYGIIFV